MQPRGLTPILGEGCQTDEQTDSTAQASLFTHRSWTVAFGHSLLSFLLPGKFHLSFSYMLVDLTPFQHFHTPYLHTSEPSTMFHPIPCPPSWFGTCHIDSSTGEFHSVFLPHAHCSHSCQYPPGRFRVCHWVATQRTPCFHPLLFRYQTNSDFTWYSLPFCVGMSFVLGPGSI